MPHKDREARLACRRKANEKRRARPEVRAQESTITKAWLKRHPGYSTAARKKYDLKRKGWTPEMITQTALEQDNRCMICKQKPNPMGPQGGAGGLVPDHKHVQPPEPRALLCNGCNSILGFAKDSPELCRAAAEYLEAWA